MLYILLMLTLYNNVLTPEGKGLTEMGNFSW